MERHHGTIEIENTLDGWFSVRSLSENALSESRSSLPAQTLQNCQKLMLAISHIWLCLFFDNSEEFG